MKVNLQQIPADGSPLHVRTDLDLADYRRWGERPFQEPVRIEAVFHCWNGVVGVDYTIDSTLRGKCSRCLDDVERPFSIAMSHILVDRVEDERSDRFILVPDQVLDLGELVRADVSLSMGDVLLCSEDCPGLCPKCGAKKTEGCDCPLAEPDPRFQKLRELLEEEGQS